MIIGDIFFEEKPDYENELEISHYDGYFYTFINKHDSIEIINHLIKVFKIKPEELKK